MKKAIIPIIIVIILVAAAIVITTNKSKDESAMLDELPINDKVMDEQLTDEPIEEPVVINLIEKLQNDPNTQTAKLEAVDGSDSKGVAYRLVEDGNLYHMVIANMPDPEDDNQYEGWLVQTNPLKFFSTGVMEKDESDMWVLEYETDEEFPTYLRTVITEETVVDATPEKHIIEGDF